MAREEKRYPAMCTSAYCANVKSDPECVKCEEADELTAFALRYFAGGEA